jgi:hypothetical protein
MEQVKEFVERLRELNGEEIRSVVFPPGVDEYMRDRVLAGDVETVAFMHRLAWIFGMQTGQAAAVAQAEREAATATPKARRIEA